MSKLKGNNWIIVLAGGNGTRLSPFIRQWLGKEIPKQYCTFVGSRSMLEHTLDRACRIVPCSRIVTVLGEGHMAFLTQEARSTLPGTLLEQPRQKGTFNGILLAAAYIRARDPQARILILPSDHFIFPESRFTRQAETMLDLIQSLPENLVLLGVEAAGPETEYGWIQPAARHRIGINRFRPAHAVRRFLEKPDAGDARRFLARRFLWNTMITAIPLPVLWSLSRDHFPVCMLQFEFLKQVFRAVRQGRVPAEHQQLAMEHAYSQLPEIDFSHDLLQHVSERILVQKAVRLAWSDWGRLERIVETLNQLERTPHFAAESARPLHTGPVMKAG